MWEIMRIGMMGYLKDEIFRGNLCGFEGINGGKLWRLMKMEIGGKLKIFMEEIKDCSLDKMVFSKTTQHRIFARFCNLNRR